MTFRHFARLLGYVWPHKRYLYPAIACILLMAVMYSATIASVFPILKVVVEREGLHGWVNRYIVEKRLGCGFTIFDPDRHGGVSGVPSGSAKLVEVKPDSPLYASGTRADDFILELGRRPISALRLLEELATADDTANLTVYHRNTQEESSVEITLPPLKYYRRWMRDAVGMIPGGTRADERMQTVVVVLVVLFCIMLIGNIARVCATYLTVLINTRAVLDLRRQMYAHVLSLPLGQFSENTSDTMSKFVQDINDILRGLTNFFQKVVAEPFKELGVFCFALWLDWRLTLIVMFCAPAAAIIFRKLGKKIRRANRKLLIGFGQMLGRLESTLAGMRVVKAYTRENYERKKIFKIDRHVMKQQLKMGFIEALTSPLVETLGFLAGSAGILYLTHQVVNDHLDTSDFIALLLCMGAMFDPVRKLSSVYPKLQRANAAAQRVFELIDSPSEYDDDAGRPALPAMQRSIEFDHVTFTYPKATQPAVSDVSLTVNRGEIVAIVGPNGSGKTTLLSLLLRFFPLNDGRILIDGQDTGEVSLHSLRSQFSLITQESVIFPDTIAANIAYGRPDVSREVIEEAARKAFADEFIRQMPDGYDTLAGEHGATLSGGQRQRIAIARAILRDAPVLIFDEATSQVDPESEMKIHQALETILRDRTAFVIAHRYSTVSNADRIAVMDQGQLLAVAPHEELLQTCPLYTRLYETQFRNSE